MAPRPPEDGEALRLLFRLVCRETKERKAPLGQLVLKESKAPLVLKESKVRKEFPVPLVPLVPLDLRGLQERKALKETPERPAPKARPEPLALKAQGGIKVTQGLPALKAQQDRRGLLGLHTTGLSLLGRKIKRTTTFLDLHCTQTGCFFPEWIQLPAQTWDQPCRLLILKFTKLAFPPTDQK